MKPSIKKYMKSSRNLIELEEPEIIKSKKNDVP